MLKKSLVKLPEILFARPLGDVAGPTCLTCGRIVQEEQMVETHKTGCRVLVRCHGDEELRTFDFGTEQWDHTHLRRAMQRMRWFDPTKPKEDAYGPLSKDQEEKQLGREVYDV